MQNTKEGLKFDDAKRLVIQTAKDNQKIALYMAIGIFTGLRHSDIVRVTKEHLNNSSIDLIEVKTKKFTSRPIPKAFYSLIECIDLDKLPNYLFLNARGIKLMGYSYFIRQLQDYCILHLNSNKEQIGTHTLRKTFGKRFYELHPNKSEAVTNLRILFNHANETTTLLYIGVTQKKIYSVLELF